jgi:hypothetical protein
MTPRTALIDIHGQHCRRAERVGQIPFDAVFRRFHRMIIDREQPNSQRVDSRLAHATDARHWVRPQMLPLATRSLAGLVAARREDLLTIAEAARELHVSVLCLAERVREGSISPMSHAADGEALFSRLDLQRLSRAR